MPVLLVTGLTAFFGAEGALWAEVVQYKRAEAERLGRLAERLGVAPDRLEGTETGTEAALRSLLGASEGEARDRAEARLEERLEAMEAELAANPFRDEALEVKEGYAPARVEAVLAVLAELSSVEVGRLSPEARKALLVALRSELEAALELPVAEDLPPGARGRAQAFRGRLERLTARLRPILNAPHALSDERLSRTLAEVASAVGGEVRRPGLDSGSGPRFGNGPLPLERLEREAPREEVSGAVGQQSSAMLRDRTTGSLEGTAPRAAEIATLAAELGGSPARIYAWVHDRIRFDPKWGAVRGPLGALLEGEATAWDQAWLLRDLLVAAGVEARFEWGEVEVPVELLTNLTGVTDPFRAGDLLATGGVPVVLLVEGGRVVGARLTHPWVVAHVDFIPNRGATPATSESPPDTWVRMDPSLKRYAYEPGILVHDDVPFGLGEYLGSGTRLSPRRAYEDDLWAYIRANDINCQTLEQLKRAGSVVREDFPILPGTLRGKVLSVGGEALEVPLGLQQGVRLEVRDAGGAVLLAHELAWPSAYGKRVEVTYQGATAEDQETIDAHGGIFETPPYLVDLAPVLSVGGAVVAEGSAIPSAEDAEVRVTLADASGFETVRTHRTLSGEHHVLALDFGALPRELVDRHLEALEAALAAGDTREAEAEALYLLGATYLHELGSDLGDIAGWNHHRLVRLGTEALVSQTGSVEATLGGTPVAFRRAEKNVDVAGMTRGLFHTEGDRSFRRATFELLGAQGSYLEGEVFPQVLERKGIAAVIALTESVRRGQSLQRVDAGNVSSVLDAVELGADVEADVEVAVARGRIAWVAEETITVDRWTGTATSWRIGRREPPGTSSPAASGAGARPASPWRSSRTCWARRAGSRARPWVSSCASSCRSWVMEEAAGTSGAAMVRRPSSRTPSTSRRETSGGPRRISRSRPGACPSSGAGPTTRVRTTRAPSASAGRFPTASGSKSSRTGRFSTGRRTVPNISSGPTVRTDSKHPRAST